MKERSSIHGYTYDFIADPYYNSIPLSSQTIYRESVSNVRRALDLIGPARDTSSNLAIFTGLIQSLYETPILLSCSPPVRATLLKRMRVFKRQLTHNTIHVTQVARDKYLVAYGKLRALYDTLPTRADYRA